METSQHRAHAPKPRQAGMPSSKLVRSLGLGSIAEHLIAPISQV